MSNGVLGKAMSNASSAVKPYTVNPTGILFAVVSINLLNTASVDATVKVAISTSPNPSPADYIESGTIVPKDGGVYIRTATMGPGEAVFVESSNSATVIRVEGLEKEV